MSKRIVVVYDFDGTITTKDTLLEFIKFTEGHWAFYWGFLIHLPVLVAFVLRLYPNWKVKQQIFSYYYKGKRYSDFKKAGQDFISRLNLIIKSDAIPHILKSLKNKSDVYVVTASIYEWVAPWCCEIGVKKVLGTKVEVDKDGYLTGRFLSANCFGQEKVNRLLKEEPNRNSYILYAYGDSRGDKEMIDFADKGYYNKF